MQSDIAAGSIAQVQHKEFINHKHPARIHKELDDLTQYLQKTQNFQIQILQIQSQIQYGIFLIHGPLQSPYEGYSFRVQIIWPFDYPYKPPKARFIDPIWNPFINQKGQICIDILIDQFSPALTIRPILLSISSLISEYKLQAQSFQNVQAASQMMNNYNYFFKVAKQKAQLYSYKKKQIYHQGMRSLPQQLKILHYKQQQIQEAIKKDLQNKKFKTKQQMKREKLFQKQLLQQEQNKKKELIQLKKASGSSITQLYYQQSNQSSYSHLELNHQSLSQQQYLSQQQQSNKNEQNQINQIYEMMKSLSKFQKDKGNQ